MQNNFLKNLLYDEVINSLSMISDELPISCTQQHIYLVYHLCGTSRRIDKIAFSESSAIDLYKLLSSATSRTKYHIVCVHLGLSVVDGYEKGVNHE